MRLHSSFQSDNLIIEHYELFLHHHVLMVMPEEPVLESAAFPNLIEEVCQCVPSVQPTAEYVLDTARTAVRDDVVYILTSCPAFLLLSGILPRWAVPLSIR